MELQFVGAAQTVTGSMHLLRTEHATILLDCGLYQGRRRESYERNLRLPLPIEEISAVVLSHAHIDHSGAMPMLVKNGYDGPIFATPATRDLCSVMLRDAASIQFSDARYLNRQAEKEGRDDDTLQPLYTEEDAVQTIDRMISLPYRRTLSIAPGIQLNFIDAGHVLGSAITILDVEERGQKRRIVFTGDLGRKDRPILRDPEVPDHTEVLICESTYGDRLHDDVDKLDDDLAAVVNRTIARGGKVLIPSFALERAQEVVFALKKLRRDNKIPLVPVFVDSPLTVKITDIFKLHPECYDNETRELIQMHESPFDFRELAYVEDVEASKAVSTDNRPSIVIAASGMCEAGRILHHLKAGVENSKNTILIVGYQAQHTLGRRLVEQRARVRIFGVERERRAEVAILNGFSAHADQNDLLAYVGACKARGPVRQVMLVHGDLRPQEVLRDKLKAQGLEEIFLPAPGDKVQIS